MSVCMSVCEGVLVRVCRGYGLSFQFSRSNFGQ